ncbi:hypothetical protein CTA2_6645 [Colletotrichum tanaceti]|uniref:Uncharacterized protein n=1 Tax=Colletotrichum tanaceti TaxID=1306861 RepID=A0A4U6XQP6_9PEZI|nr:hypothetical protein CTA2_6645 [Colletotrichum tanaceti]TKW57989.1 hypothetical protein CTA1_3079 [Colletotrichum tanaceti]
MYQGVTIKYYRHLDLETEWKRLPTILVSGFCTSRQGAIFQEGEIRAEKAEESSFVQRPPINTVKCRSPIILAISVLLLANPATEGWQFRSRPDLAPPRLNIIIPASAVEPGYLFLAPFAGLPDTPTAPHGYGHGHGHLTILDQHYEQIRELWAGNHKLVEKHEFHVVGEETGLIQIYQPIPRDLTPWGAEPEQQWIVNAIIQGEIRPRGLGIATGKILLEWSSVDHVSPDEAILPINPGQAGSGYNSACAVDKINAHGTEHDSGGERGPHSSLGVGVENHRAFRFNWTGLPSEEPAIVSLEDAGGTTLYVWWNGDTEATAWRFDEVSNKYGSREFPGRGKEKKL